MIEVSFVSFALHGVVPAGVRKPLERAGAEGRHPAVVPLLRLAWVGPQLAAVLDRERGGGPAPLDDIPLVRIEVLLDLALELGLLREREGGERSDDGNDSSARQQTHEMTSAVVTGTTIRRSVTPRIRKGGDQLS